MVIEGGRIASAGGYLPLSDNPALPQKYGTRHQAGIGITERCDAVALIVSEERGEVSLAVEGDIQRIDSPDVLKSRLESMIVNPRQQQQSRWHGAFTSNVAAKIVSFTLVLVLWVFIGGQPRAEVWLTLPLEYRNMPANMEIVGEMVNRVDVGVRGPRTLISTIAPDQLKANVDLSQATPGLNYVRVTPDNVRTPLGTEVTRITPSVVRIRLEDVKTRSIPVKVHFVGKLPTTLRLVSAGVEPPLLTIQGPTGLLKKTREVFTEPVDLSEIKESTRILIGVEISSSQIRLAPDDPSQVTVDLKVEKVQ